MACSAGSSEHHRRSACRSRRAAVLERVLSRSAAKRRRFRRDLRRGPGGSGISLDDRKVEELSSGRDRGAGIRVVVGETTGFAHTADLSEPGLLAAAEAAAAVARSGGDGPRTVALEKQVYDVRAMWRAPERPSPSRTKVELSSVPTTAARSAGASIAQVSAGYMDLPAAGADRQFRRPVDGVTSRCAPVSLFTVWPPATPGCRRAMRLAFDARLRGVRGDPRRGGGRRAAAVALASCPPARRRRECCRSCIKRGSGGILFHEACGHGLEADAIVKDSLRYAGRVGEPVASRSSRWSTTAPLAAIGAASGSTTRVPDPAQRAHRGGSAHRLHVGLPPRPQDGRTSSGTGVGRATSTCRWCG